MSTLTVFLDTETTGLDATAQLVEIAVVDESGNVLFESFCKPTVPVDPGAQAVHGIGAETLTSAPAWPEIAGQVQAALEGKIVVIFNSDFDTRILRQTADAHVNGLSVEDYDAAILWILQLKTECAMYRAASIYGATNRYGTISLVNAAAAAGIDFRGRAHSAAGDAATTAALWKAMKGGEAK